MRHNFGAVVGCATVITSAWLGSSVGAATALMANTVLVVGGESNPNGTNMDKQLSGYFSTAPGTPYAGYDYRAVQWPAGVLPYPGALTYRESQAAGVAALDKALAEVYQPGDKIVIVGYSAGSVVVDAELQALQARLDAGQAAPSPDDLTYVVLANPNRPNGGSNFRFPGINIPPPVDINFDPILPDTDYHGTDISWEYDPVSDSPNYTGNPLVALNETVAAVIRHTNYYDVDPADPSSVLQDVTDGNTHYITLTNGHLPLVEGLELIGVPKFLIEPFEPTLKRLVDRAYDRSISPGTPTKAELFRRARAESAIAPKRTAAQSVSVSPAASKPAVRAASKPAVQAAAKPAAFRAADKAPRHERPRSAGAHRAR